MMTQGPPGGGERAFDRAIRSALGALTAVALFAMMTLTCVDVVGRYVFNRPVPGGLEIIEILVAATVFGALPLVTLREEHVMVDLLDAVVPDWMLRVQNVAACVLSAAVCGVAAWQLLLRANRMLGYGDTTAVLKLTLYPLTYLMSAAMAIVAMIFLVLAFRPPARKLIKD
jgi:TRAP-type C4-dicarboxylate transport system permease small subunit